MTAAPTTVIKVTQHKAEYGRQNAHPLAGKNVVRDASRRPAYNAWSSNNTRTAKTVKERGIVTLSETINYSYRGHCPVAGEWFVLSKSGATAYRLTDDWKLDVC